MNIIYNNTKPMTTLYRVRCGDVFKCGDECFMKINHEEPNAVSIKTGELRHFQLGEIVESVIAKVVIE